MKKITIIVSVLLVTFLSYGVILGETSDDTNLLENLSVYTDEQLQPQQLTPAFDSEQHTYELWLHNDIKDVDIALEFIDTATEYDVVVKYGDDELEANVDELYNVDNVPFGTSTISVNIYTESAVSTGNPDEAYVVLLHKSGLNSLLAKYQVTDPSAWVNLPLKPLFDETKFYYLVKVPDKITEIELFAELDEENIDDYNDLFADIDVELYIDTDLGDGDEAVEYDSETRVVENLEPGHNLVEIKTTTDGGLYFDAVYLVDIVKDDALKDLKFYTSAGKLLSLTPVFNSYDTEYELVLPVGSTSILYTYKLFNDDDLEAKVTFNGVVDTDMTLQTPYGSSEFVLTIYTDGDADDVVAEYTVNVLRPVPLEDITLDPVQEEFVFKPLVLSYSVYVDEAMDEISLTYEKIEGVTYDVTVYNDGKRITVTNGEYILALEEGQNTIKVVTNFEDAELTYTILITRGYYTEWNQYRNTYRFRYGWLNGSINSASLQFRGDALQRMMLAFKHGSNKNNEILVDANNLEEVVLSYDVYKYMVQHKVMLIFENGIMHNGEVKTLSFKDLKLSRFIKGPFAFDTITYNLETGKIETFDTDTKKAPGNSKDKVRGNSGK